MLHHISLGVADLERAAAFYDAVLATLGYVRGKPDDPNFFKFAIKHQPGREHVGLRPFAAAMP